MTIITPGKGFTLNMSVLCIAVLVIGFAFWFVALYSQVVSLEHQVNNAENSIENLKVSNAELKNVVFERTAPKQLLQLASDLGLSKINSPLYLEVGESSWSVSRY